MSTATTRYGAHKALEALEWIDKHIQARPNEREVREKLYKKLDDITRFLTRIAGGFSP
jgi:pyrroloquinoline quinone (PQQ) biosynthesis protein C